MSPSAGKPVVAIVDSKSLRRASITSFFEPWANSEDLQLISFNLDRARDVLHAETNLKMVIISVGGESIAESKNLQQLKMLHALAAGVPFVIISDKENAQEIAAACSAETKGFIHSGIEADLACEALSFILHGGSYFPPSAVRQLHTQPGQADREEADKLRDSDGSEPEANHSGGGTNDKLTVREHQVLEHIRLGLPNKMIARQLGMMEATVKVHVRQLMRKFHASNRTQLALGQSRVTADVDLLTERSTQQSGSTPFALRLVSFPRTKSTT
jgi:DNA-binding NarL/FixJ family response regulator